MQSQDNLTNIVEKYTRLPESAVLGLPVFALAHARGFYLAISERV